MSSGQAGATTLGAYCERFRQNYFAVRRRCRRVEPRSGADLPTSKPATMPPTPTLASCASVTDFFPTACPLTYYGVTFYGTVDIGGGWMSHGSR